MPGNTHARNDQLLRLRGRAGELDLEAQELPRPPDDLLVCGQLRDGGALVLAPLLPVGQAHLALRDGAAGGEVLVVVHNRLGRTVAGEAADVVASDDELVVVEAVLVPRPLRAHAEAPADIGVHVGVVVVVVAAKVVLHALPAVDEEVVVCLVVRRAVVIVDILLRAVVVDEEVVMDLAPRHRHRGAAVAHRREEGLAVPRVERAVVAALAAGGEGEIVRNLVAAAEAVVGVDPGARPVEEDIAAHRRLRRLRLHEEGRLLLVEANLAGAAAGDGGVAWVVAICPVHPRVRVVFDPLAGPARVGRRLVGVPPRGDRVPSDEGEVGVGDGGVAVVPRHHHRVPVDPLERARVESDPLGALQEDGAHAVQRPIAGGRDAVRVHVRVARGAEGDAAVRDAARRRPT
mmetsp:Transcript_36501/g.114634  ORF Transcript_36501/g.114634 Transcript_36501/m.114634 type:complete len:403 (-) Transcript_36501:1292-2500(-)